MIFLGCDPGLSGAVALWKPEPNALAFIDMPTLRLKPGSNKRTLDALELARALDERLDLSLDKQVGCVVIEQAGSRPGEGTASAHANGRNWGVAYGILCSHFLPIEIVAPHVWKRGMNCPKAKDGARARASQLLPGHAGKWARVKDDGRAEAALLALYAELRFKQRELGQ